MVGAVVRMRGPREPNHPGAACPARDVVATPGIFIARAWRHHHVLMTQLAQKVTSGRQMASNPTAPFGIEFRDVDDLHAVGPASDAARAGRAKVICAPLRLRRTLAFPRNCPRTCRRSRHSQLDRAGRFALPSLATSRGYPTPTVQYFRHGSCIKNYDGVVTRSQSSARTTRTREPRGARAGDRGAAKHTAEVVPRRSPSHAAGAVGVRSQAAGTSTSASPRPTRFCSSSASGCGR